MPIFLRIVVAFRLGNGGKILPGNPDFAGARFFEADESPQKRALAGARAAKDDESFAALDVEGDAVQDFPAGIADADVPQGNHRSIQ